MRGVKREADTVELELSAEQLRALSDGLAAQVDEPHPLPVVVNASRAARPRNWTTWVGAVLIAAMSSGITYFLVRPGEPIEPEAEPLTAFRIAEEPQPPPPPAAAEVLFVNPFDRTEVFSFPAGTSPSKAREAVAELLLKRAQERLTAAQQLRRRFTTSDDHGQSASILAQSGLPTEP